jgi:hypothetical protein
MTMKKVAATLLETTGALTFLYGVSRFSLTTAIILCGIIVTVFGIALEKDAQ